MKSSNKSTGVGLPSLLFIIFLVLKLTNNIDWSWWWVTSPLWIPLVFAIGLLMLILFGVLAAMIFGLSPEKIETKIKSFKDKI